MAEENAAPAAETIEQQQERIKRNMISRFVDRALNTHDNGLPKANKRGFILLMFDLDDKGMVKGGTDIGIVSNEVKLNASAAILGAVYSGIVDGKIKPADPTPAAPAAVDPSTDSTD